MTTLMGSPVGKKKSAANSEAKRYGTMIRVNDAFAEELRKACALEGMSVAEFSDAFFLPIVQKRYRDLLAKESKRVAGQGQGGDSPP